MKIRKLRYIDKLEQLNISKNDMVIYGSAPLVIRGLKGKNDDLDVLVKEEVWNKLKADYPNNINGDYISKYNNAKLKMKLADIYLFKEEIWEATLLYSQVDKSMKEEPIGHEARFRNAQLRYYIGEFDWALAVLNILKSATSKLIANDAMTLSLVISDNLEYDTIALQRLAKADYYIYQKRYDVANQILDSVNVYNPNEVSMPYLLSRKAQIAHDNKDYELADSLYKRVYQGYPDSYIADKALMDDAFLLENYLDMLD